MCTQRTKDNFVIYIHITNHNDGEKLWGEIYYLLWQWYITKICRYTLVLWV